MRLQNILSEREMKYIEEIGEEYLKAVLNHKAHVYKVDKDKTASPQGFVESSGNEIFYADPVEVPCILKIESQTNESYADSVARYEEYGNITIFVYEKTLRDLKLFIDYGDYVAIEVKDKFVFYTVVNNDIKNISFDKSFGGFAPLFKAIECAPSDQNEIQLI